MNTIRFTVLVLLCPLMTLAQRYADGPYVFYRNDSILVKTITEKGDLAAAETKVYIQPPLPELPVSGFSISLKQKITTPPNESPAAGKMFILSDIEGEFEAGRDLLLAAGVIDTQFNWTFGTGKLIIAGDLFDRGTTVLPWLWLLYSLEDKATAAGGAVHVVLGNHDVMQLAGDFRYTDARYFKYAWLMGKELRQVFAADSELGRWLRSKNVIEKIGDLLVMHAGVSPELIGKQWPLQRINENSRQWLGVPRKQIPDSLQFLFDSRGPFWYRGYFYDPKATAATVDSTLQFYNAKHIIVGHTITDTTIVTRFEGKVIGVDVDQHEGHHQGLMITGARYEIIDRNGSRKELE
ncbi:Calcineurin-like phosphoesterase [Chitinophaga jiangningensis]|uniref:Calcineurin-like phosphoesterase n=1 Tax=Chitinophaga jiangningensis TaxID=1419482 RepID=A0A1M7CYM5_9BACT|nr:metallophosphoesterase [Chitinophaga jiangningensis]SHL72361.1 Calcineurin-like phosphoesterase [Chitinophaga jiangningensis]